MLTPHFIVGVLLTELRLRPQQLLVMTLLFLRSTFLQLARSWVFLIPTHGPGYQQLLWSGTRDPGHFFPCIKPFCTAKCLYLHILLSYHSHQFHCSDPEIEFLLLLEAAYFLILPRSALLSLWQIWHTIIIRWVQKLSFSVKVDPRKEPYFAATLGAARLVCRGWVMKYPSRQTDNGTQYCRLSCYPIRPYQPSAHRGPARPPYISNYIAMVQNLGLNFINNLAGKDFRMHLMKE